MKAENIELCCVLESPKAKQLTHNPKVLASIKDNVSRYDSDTDVFEANLPWVLW
jgi:hypothetical protein